MTKSDIKLPASASDTAPFYGLYGERFISKEPGFIHIEDIADRSSELGWLIKPHRHNHLFQVLCVFNSELEIQLKQDKQTLQGSWIATIPPGVIHGFRFQPNSEGMVLSITDSVLSEELSEGYGGQASELFQGPQLIELDPHDGQFKQFLNYLDCIRAEFSQLRSDQSQALALLARLVLGVLNRQLQSRRLSSGGANKESQLLSRFRALIENHYLEHWPLSHYAEQLHISNSTLNRLCQQHLDSNPKRLIQDRLLSEAKRKLMYTQQPLEKIAYSLGFKDYPYFSRFFKKLEGETAGNYRKRSDTGL